MDDLKEEKEDLNIQIALKKEEQQAFHLQEALKKSNSTETQEYLAYFEKTIIPNKSQLIDKLSQHSILYVQSNNSQYNRVSYFYSDFSTHSQIIKLQIGLGPFVTDVTILNMLGESPIHQRSCFSQGSFGKIYLINCKQQQICVKCISTNLYYRKELLISLSLKEFFFMKIASALGVGPFIRNQLGFDLILYESCIQIAMERCYTHSQKRMKDESLQQIKENVLMLHSLNIIHFDLKQANTCFSPRFNRQVLIDFGFSEIIKQQFGTKIKTGFAGTIGYCLPEMEALFVNKKKAFIDPYFNDCYCLTKFKTLTNQVQIKFKSKQYSKYILLTQLKFALCSQQFTASNKLFNSLALFGNFERQILQFFWELVPCEATNRFYNQTLSNFHKDSIEFIKLKSMYTNTISKQNLKWELKNNDKKEILERRISFLNEAHNDVIHSESELYFNDKLKYRMKQYLLDQRNLTHKQEIFSKFVSYVSFQNNMFDASLQDKIQVSKQFEKYYIFKDKQHAQSIDSLKNMLLYLLDYCTSVPLTKWKVKSILQIYETFCTNFKDYTVYIKYIDQVFNISNMIPQEKFMIINVMIKIAFRCARREYYNVLVALGRQRTQRLEEFGVEHKIKTQILNLHLSQKMYSFEHKNKLEYQSKDILQVKHSNKLFSDETWKDVLFLYDNDEFLQRCNSIMACNKKLYLRFVIQIIYLRISILIRYGNEELILKFINYVFYLCRRGQQKFQYFDYLIFASDVHQFQRIPAVYRLLAKQNTEKSRSKIILEEQVFSLGQINKFHFQLSQIDYKLMDENSVNCFNFCKDFIKNATEYILSGCDQDKGGIVAQAVCFQNISYNYITGYNWKTCPILQEYVRRYKSKFKELLQDNHKSKSHFKMYDQLFNIKRMYLWSMSFKENNIFLEYMEEVSNYFKLAKCPKCLNIAGDFMDLVQQKKWALLKNKQAQVRVLYKHFSTNFGQRCYFWHGQYQMVYEHLLDLTYELGCTSKSPYLKFEQSIIQGIQAHLYYKKIHQKQILRLYRAISQKQSFYCYFILIYADQLQLISSTIAVLLQNGLYEQIQKLYEYFFRYLQNCFSIYNYSDVIGSLTQIKQFFAKQSSCQKLKFIQIFMPRILRQKCQNKKRNGQICSLYFELLNLQSNFTFNLQITYRILQLINSKYGGIRSRCHVHREYFKMSIQKCKQTEIRKKEYYMKARRRYWAKDYPKLKKLKLENCHQNSLQFIKIQQINLKLQKYEQIIKMQ